MEADEKFLKLFHNNLVGMILTDENHIITDVNEHLLKMAGVHKNEVIGKSGLELGLMKADDVVSLLRELGETGSLSNIELPYTTPGNQKLTFLFSTESILIRGKKYWLSTVIDISRKKQIEDVISGSELRFRTLAKTAPVGIFETDEKGNTIYVNEAWMEYSGLSFEEAMNNEWMNMIHPEDREDQINKWVERSLKGETSFSEYRIINKAGSCAG